MGPTCAISWIEGSRQGERMDRSNVCALWPEAMKDVVESNWKIWTKQLSMKRLERWRVDDTHFAVEA